MGDERNKPYVDLLNGLSTTLSKITKLLIKTAPLDIFAITENTAGTITLTQLLQIQVFFTSIVVLSMILVLLALLLLVYCLTPLAIGKYFQPQIKGLYWDFP
jgi:Na+/H+-dicarboxylate symporter